MKTAAEQAFDDYWYYIWRMMVMAEEDFKDYFRIQNVEARPYVVDEDMTDIVVGEGMIPKEGDMIARNPRNRDVLWLMPKEVFETNFEGMAQARGAPKADAKPGPTRASTKQEF